MCTSLLWYIFVMFFNREISIARCQLSEMIFDETSHSESGLDKKQRHEDSGQRMWLAHVVKPLPRPGCGACDDMSRKSQGLQA